MRCAIISDIHGNLTALEAVLADAVERAGGSLSLEDAIAVASRPDSSGRYAPALSH